jgi:FHA domain
MAKLYLKYEQAVLKEIALSQGVCTIGRLPDNSVQIDNLAVSGHHAKIYWNKDKYLIEDTNSLNGTYVNNARITQQALLDGDVILIGKHTLAFENKWQVTSPNPVGKISPQPIAKLEQTAVLDTKHMKERIAGGGANAPAARVPAPAPSPQGQPAAAPAGGHVSTRQYTMPVSTEKIGVLTVVDGKTDQERYLLTSKMSVIGKSEMASIKLKGWFAPKMAALISKRETDYFIAASEKDIKVKINGEEIAGQKSLADGDTIEVAGVKMMFAFQGGS